MTMAGVTARRSSRVALTTFLTAIAVVWLVPLLAALVSSFRFFEDDTQVNGVFSWPRALTLENYREAWNVGDIWGHFGKTLFIVIPALVITLWFSSMVGYAATRYSWRFNVTVLVFFTAGNLMPPQVVFQPLFRIYSWIPLPDWLSDTDTGSLLGTKIAVILIHVAYQSGFCTFVFSNYMKTLPKELGEAARVDGAGVWRQYWQIIMPLSRPVFAALATLEFTWLYNDFFWGQVLLNQGAERPITSSISVLNGQYASNYNLIAAASLMIALPSLAVYIALQKQFISGLTLGSTK